MRILAKNFSRARSILGVEFENRRRVYRAARRHGARLRLVRAHAVAAFARYYGAVSKSTEHRDT